MESHEEKVFKAMRETQEKEAKQKMLERAEEIRRARVTAEKGGHKLGGSASSHYSSGFGSASSSSSHHNVEPSSFEHHSPPPSFTTSLSSSSSSAKPNRAMKLGTNKDIMPAFIEQQVKQAQPASSSSQQSNSLVHNTPNEKVHIKVDEKINLTCGKDGGVQNLEILGVLSVRVASEEDGRIKIAIRNNDSRALQIQTNPNVDKNLFKNNSLIGLRDPTKSFPVATDVGVLKWRYQSQEETEIPLTINCWPSETKNGCDVSIEYELQKLNLELNNVSIIVPIPSNVTAPIIKSIDGDYQYEKYKNCLIWKISTIDQSNSTGSLEFSVAGHASDFFPVNVNFSSNKSYCDIQVSGVSSADNASLPVKNSIETNFSVERYEIV